ncbi:leucine-rich_repeat domain-containing protein [Hexamita inflata]|uniref:Leucine-rich repeat domain-containing protein n=1 Tax=Hexamita inflata TaxID=28002 RepID=A0AA86P525_9EUKA|nr:leucine-rich repeat domain-containing protein [Hexamita inflata]
MIKLVKLQSSWNVLKDINVLRSLLNIRELELQGNKQIDITPLQYLVKLTNLSLYVCQIYEISVLRPLVNLEFLILHDNNIINISPLESLKQLNSLYCEYNKISDLSSIKQHHNYENFYMNSQQQPTGEEIIIANKMHIVDISTTALKRIQTLRCATKNHIKVAQQRSMIIVQQSFNNQEYFINNVVSLFNTLNSQCIQ